MTREQLDDLQDYVRRDITEAINAACLVDPLIDFSIVSPHKILMRRLLTRHVVLVLCRLFDKPRFNGRRGATASVEAVLECADAISALTPDDTAHFKGELSKLKRNYAKDGGAKFDDLYLLRDTQVAHSLDPHEKTTEPPLWWDLVRDLAFGTLEFVRALDEKLTLPQHLPPPIIDAGVILAWRENAIAFWHDRQQ